MPSMYFLCHVIIVSLVSHNDVRDVVSQALLLARWEYLRTIYTHPPKN